MVNAVTALHRAATCIPGTGEDFSPLLSRTLALFSEHPAPPRSISNAVWAIAKLGFHDLPVMAMVPMIVRAAPEFGPQAIANAVWSFAAMLCFDLPLMEIMAAAVMTSIRKFGP